MKGMILLLALISNQVISAETVDLPESECSRKCTIYSYTFQPGALGYCKQTEKCDVYKWNDEENSCEVTEKGKLYSYPIHCRDIPPY